MPMAELKKQVEFEKCERDAKLLLADADTRRSWRLASVDEVNGNLAKIKQHGILNSRDPVRLLDGCVENYRGLKQYRPNMEDMILVKTDKSRPEDGSFAPDMYSGVQLYAKGGTAALLLACEDKITEAIYFVLHSIVQKHEKAENRQEELNKLTKKLEEEFGNGRTLLHYAADQPGNQKLGYDIAKCLKDEFKYGIDSIEAGDKDGMTALHLAALHGNAKLCEFLVNECKMRVAEKDRNKRTALCYAKQLSDSQKAKELPELLQKYCTDKDFKKCKRDAHVDRWSNWRLASVDEVNDNLAKIKGLGILNSEDPVRLLDGCVEKYRGLKQYRPNMEAMILVKTDISRHPDGSFNPDMYSSVKLHAKGGGAAALLLACEDRITEAIYFVLYSIVQKHEKAEKRQEELNILTKRLEEEFGNGRTLLHYAADQPGNQKLGYDVAECLKEKFKDGMDLIQAADIYGRTALHFAAFHGNKELCRLLIESCEMRADETDINKENVLHFAVKGKQIKVFEDLSKLTAVQSITGSRDAQGRTALHKAAAQGSTEMIRILLSNISKDKENQLYIREAKLHLQPDIDLGEEDQIRLGFIRHADLFGQTALLEAARAGHVEAVERLLEYGSDPLRERNSDGRTALHFAVQLSSGNTQAKTLAEKLLKYCKSEKERCRLYERNSDDRIGIYHAVQVSDDDCTSDVERSLLLWASATGMGTAEEYLKTKREEQGEKKSEVEDYLEKERERVKESSKDLLSSAIKLGHEKMAWELVNRGSTTTQIKKGKWSRQEERRVDNLLKQMINIGKMPERGRDQPAICDSLDRKEFAQGLATLFLNPYVRSPLTVGIFGDWGMGKSSLMVQTEIILLKTAAQLAFPHLLETEQFPGCIQIEQSRKGRRKYDEINKAMKNSLLSSTSKEYPLLEFLDGDYKEEYYEVYKSLALIDRSQMFETKDEDEEAVSTDNHYSLTEIPAILTVRYNAWHYQNESEAWAGLAVEITKAMENSMTTAQKVRCHCKYAWTKQRQKIWLELFLPCLLALFLSGCVAFVLWKLISTSKNNEVKQLRYGSIPVTILLVVWTVVRNFFSVFKPISAQMKGYFSKPDHTTKLGYQQQVIFDIKFLFDEIGKKPSWIWKFIGLLCNLCHIHPDYSDTVEDTSISKSPAPDKKNIRMIVFVDDLDRCQENVILKVLSAVNLVLAACDINVILGMDEKMIARAMKCQFPDTDPKKLEELGKKYISKIVQLPLVLPDTSEDETKKFLDEQLGPAFEVTKHEAAGDSWDQTNEVQTGPRTLQSLSTSFPGIFNQYARSKNLLSGFKDWLPGCISSVRKETKRRLRTMSLKMIMANYSDEERKALNDLSEAATGERKLPREWKRFLTYHRVAWNILSQSDTVKKTPGWQMQLVIWVFCCWQWEQQINDIIKDWKKLVPVNGFSGDGDGCVESNKPSLKSIIKKYQLHQEENGVGGKTKQGAQENKEEKDQQELVTQIKEKKKKKREDWDSLKETLDKYTYDVSLDCILSFQKFRLHCDIGHLSSPKNNGNSKEKKV